MSYELTMQLDLVETTALSKSSIRVLTADNGEFSVGLSEDDSLDSSVTEVKGNGNVGVIFIVDILDGVGGPGSVDWVAVIGGTGFHDRDGGAGNVGRRVNNGNLQARILFKHVIARIDSVVLRIVVPVDIRAEDSTTSQLLPSIQLRTTWVRSWYERGFRGSWFPCSVWGRNACAWVQERKRRRQRGPKQRRVGWRSFGRVLLTWAVVYPPSLYTDPP